jgi:hypothetical protein
MRDSATAMEPDRHHARQTDTRIVLRMHLMIGFNVSQSRIHDLDDVSVQQHDFMII